MSQIKTGSEKNRNDALKNAPVENERNEYEHQLLESAFRRNTAMCTISDPHSGQFLYVNDAWLNALGYTLEEVIGKTAAEIGFWGKIDKRHNLVSRLRSERRVEGYQTSLISKSGEIKIIDISVEILSIGSQEFYFSSSIDITEKRKLEEEQKLLQGVFTESFRVNSTLCGITNPATGKIEDVNDAWLNTLGYTKEEVIGKTSLDLNLWGNSEARDKLFDELERNGKLENYESKICTKTGEKITVLTSSVVLQVGDEKRLFFSGQNIDEQRKIEQKQNENLDIFSASFQFNIGLCTISDPVTGEYHDANDVWLKTMGYTREEVIGKTSLELNIWGSPENRQRAMNKLREEGRLRSYETAIYAKSGEKRSVLTNAEILRIGDVDRIFFSLTDITELQRSANELKASEKRFRDIAEYSSDWFWELDSDFKFTFVSEGANFFELLDHQEMIGKHAYGYFSELGKVAGNEPIYKAMKERVSFRNVRVEFASYIDSISYHQYSGKPIFDQFGRFNGYRGTGSDVTQEVLAEQKRINMEERLQQAQKMEAVGQLTGGIAHDFNNLLAIVIGNAELLEEEDEGNSQLAAIMRAATRGAELTQSLLAFSRKQLLAPKAFRLDEQLTPMLQILPRTLGEIITIRSKSQPDLWECYADPGHVENVLLNLAINARDAMPQGGFLDIDYSNETTEDGDFVCLSVTDTGSGIPPEVMEHILEPFFTTKDVGSGSGLGLSMAYGFADQSHGTLNISSELGKGTVVELRLPRATGREDV